MQVLVVSLLIVGKLPYFLIVCILGFLPKKVDVFCQKERFSASFCASFQHWPATAARHQCFQCIQALGKKKKPAAAVNRSSLSFCGNWVKLLENFSPADNGPTLSEALGAGKM